MTNTQQYLNSKGEIWLNVASSVYVLEDFVNLDNHIFLHFKNYLPLLRKIMPGKYHGWINSYIEATNKAKMLKHDCRKKLMFDDNSVDHILCSHFLEHVYPDETQFILQDFYRVLKPGGTLHIIVPDIEVNINNYLKQKKDGKPEAADNFILDTLLSKRDRGTFKYRMLELHGGFGLQHRWMYDNASMQLRVKDCGFKISGSNTTPSEGFRKNDDSVHVIGIK